MKILYRPDPGAESDRMRIGKWRGIMFRHHYLDRAGWGPGNILIGMNAVVEEASVLGPPGTHVIILVRKPPKKYVPTGRPSGRPRKNNAQARPASPERSWPTDGGTTRPTPRAETPPGRPSNHPDVQALREKVWAEGGPAADDPREDAPPRAISASVARRTLGLPVTYGEIVAAGSAERREQEKQKKERGRLLALGGGTAAERRAAAKDAEETEAYIDEFLKDFRQGG